MITPFPGPREAPLAGPPPVLEAADLRKDYVGGDGNPIHVLTGVQLAVQSGEFIAIIGASGSGKSTLLHLLGALDQPTGGEIRLAGQAYADLTPGELAWLRNRQLGFVFQFHHLLRDFTALENVMMPLLIGGAPAADAAARARAVLESMGLAERLLHRPGQLSGGEQQRVAVARALAREPAVILADEPSGNLDPANADRLHALLAAVVRDQGRAMVVVTHNRALADLADRVLALHEGVLALPRGDEVMAP
jgi:lipoprotein-releasing system ATP-binding protein